MSTPSYTMSDSITMLRRKLKHTQRYPGVVLATVIVPAGLLLLFVFAFGLVAKSPDTASNLPMLFQLFSFLSSAFVPAESMAPGLRVFAKYQPFTGVTETLRGLLTGTPIGGMWILAIAWCVVIALVGYLWSRKRFQRGPRA